MTTTFTTETADKIPAAMTAFLRGAIRTLPERERGRAERVMVKINYAGLTSERTSLGGGFFCANKKVQAAMRALAGIDAIANANAAVSQ